eukprot:INCI3645.3.p2 GENE.INCI3645.3~~INCI3645.3.p2  ORF type:complete len:122 (-),score=26.13 INCI3645.3:340-705(-)
MNEPGETASVRRRLYKDGFRDGGAQVSQSALQEGFDSGFQDGAELGFRVGRLFGQAKSLLEFQNSAATDNATNVLEPSEEEELNQLLARARTELETKLEWTSTLTKLQTTVDRVVERATIS